MRVVIYLGGELAQDIFDRGSVYTLRDVVKTFLYLFLFFTFQIHCSYFVIANLVFMLRYILEVVITFFHLSLHVLFLLSLYVHASYILYAIFYFYFTLRCCDEFCLKCFRNTSCQSLSYHKLFSCKVFHKHIVNRRHMSQFIFLFKKLLCLYTVGFCT